MENNSMVHSEIQDDFYSIMILYILQTTKNNNKDGGDEMKYNPNHINFTAFPYSSPSPLVVLFSNQVDFPYEHDAVILNIPSVLQHHRESLRPNASEETSSLILSHLDFSHATPLLQPPPCFKAMWTT